MASYSLTVNAVSRTIHLPSLDFQLVSNGRIAPRRPRRLGRLDVREQGGEPASALKREPMREDSI